MGKKVIAIVAGLAVLIVVGAIGDLAGPQCIRAMATVIAITTTVVIWRGEPDDGE